MMYNMFTSLVAEWRMNHILAALVMTIRIMKGWFLGQAKVAGLCFGHRHNKQGGYSDTQLCGVGARLGVVFVKCLVARDICGAGGTCSLRSKCSYINQLHSLIFLVQRVCNESSYSFPDGSLAVDAWLVLQMQI